MFSRLSLAASILLSALIPSPSHAEDLNVQDAVVAVVNNESITQKEVVERAMPIISTLDKDLSQADRQKRIQLIIATACKAMVHEKLLVAEADRLFKANEELKNRIEDRLKERIEEETRRAGGELQFREALKKQGLTYSEFTELFRKRIKQDFVLYQFVQKDVSTTPREVMNYYLHNKQEFQQPPKVKFRQIFIRASDPTRTREKARQLADELRSKLVSGADFAALARGYSEEPRGKEEGGLWDFTNRGARPLPIDDALFTLPLQEISQPIETEIGCTIVKVEARQPGKTLPIEEVQGDIEKTLNRQKMDKRYEALITRLESENYVSYLSL